MSKIEKLKEKARSLEAKDPKAAIEHWLEVLQLQEEEGNPNNDLSAYNRIGDLYLKVKDPAQAADFYERAVDKYAELGFHNNAIALCNKVLRNAPGRQTTYLKLAKLYASKGFYGEAKQNFVEYASRMQKAGKMPQAIAALKELTDLSPDSSELRELLQEHQKLYGSPERRQAGHAPAEQPDITKSGKRKTSNLVFLDLDEPTKPKGKPARPAAAAPPPSSPPPAAEEASAATLLSDVSPEPDSSLEIESTSLASDDDAASSSPTIEGLERTIDFRGTESSAPVEPLINEAMTSEEVPRLPDFEPTLETQEESEEAGPEEHAAAPAPARPAATPKVGPFVRPKAPATQGAKPVPPVVPRRPAASAPPAGPPSRVAPKRKVEVPPLELEPDFASEATAETHEVDDEPLAADLGVDGIVNQGDEHAGALLFRNMMDDPGTAAAPSIEELEGRVADDPDDPDAHRALGEALIEAGERDRGIEELDLATAGFENRGDLGESQGMVEEVLRLDPNSVRHRQKLVEYAFKVGDKAGLIDAYLELADTLLRSDLPDKARAVYQRVTEHDPGNERAKAALAMFAPVATPTPPPGRPEREGRVAPKDAKMKVRDDSVDGETDFVDLGAIILDEDAQRDTRMKVADEEPTGDEEKDFHEMLARFRQGIEENIEETDFQSHYDLGVAFKEMGLLDEAIAEFQKALRAPDGKLKTSEALGICFCEKKAYVVAETILRRALDFPAASENERLGVLYWLGRALEAQGKKPEAKELYGRVFAIDIRFADVGERVKVLAKSK